MMCARSAKAFGFMFLTAAAALAFVGCGKSDRGSVSGKLLHKDGSPVTMARVVAHSKDTGATAYGTTDKDGYFMISDGLAPGDYDVNILEDRGDPDNRRPAKIASKYRDPARSGLSVNIQAGNTAKLSLTLEPPQTSAAGN
jgi:hypothetical protein